MTREEIFHSAAMLSKISAQGLMHPSSEEGWEGEDGEGLTVFSYSRHLTNFRRPKVTVLSIHKCPRRSALRTINKQQKIK